MSNRTPPQDQGVRLTPEMFAAGTTVRCEAEKCGNTTWVQVFLIRKISKIATGTPEDVMVNVPTVACNRCGHINADFIPEGFRVGAGLTTATSVSPVVPVPSKISLLP